MLPPVTSFRISLAGPEVEVRVGAELAQELRLARLGGVVHHHAWLADVEVRVDVVRHPARVGLRDVDDGGLAGAVIVDGGLVGRVRLGVGLQLLRLGVRRRQQACKRHHRRQKLRSQRRRKCRAS